MAEIVSYGPEHQAGFRALVLSVLAEFGLSEDDAIDADLRAPERSYDAVWIVLEGDSVAGSAAARTVGPGIVELKRMYLAPALRGQGLGRRLLERVLEWSRQQGARRLVLDTLPQMTAARRLYEAAGFSVAGERVEEGERERRHELLLALNLR